MEEKKFNKAIQFIQTTPQELQEQISKGVKNQIEKSLNELKPKDNDELLTRKEVAEFFKVDLSTIHHWCKKRRLNSYGIGNRVYFKRSEIEKSLIPLNV